MAFARRAAQHTAPKEYRRQRHKEFKDFYQQQALRDTQYDYSWYVNCGVLVAVALWAWRERRTVLELSSQRGGGDEPLYSPRCRRDNLFFVKMRTVSFFFIYDLL